jgi:hypothetical protein
MHQHGDERCDWHEHPVPGNIPEQDSPADERSDSREHEPHVTEPEMSGFELGGQAFARGEPLSVFFGGQQVSSDFDSASSSRAPSVAGDLCSDPWQHRRMASRKTKAAAYVPSMADSAVQAKTGKDWARWFSTLDAAGALTLDHKSIAALLMRQHAIPGWWCQMITVEYERSRGLRERYETASGYQVAVTKTIATSLSGLYAATSSAAQRKKWFPAGAFQPSSQTQDKYCRGAWKDHARLEMGFYAKGAGKAQIALQVSKLAKRSDVESERAAWRSALTKLQSMLEK